MTNREYTEIREAAMKLKQAKKGYLAYLRDEFDCDRKTALDIFDKLENNEPIEVQSIEEAKPVKKEDSNLIVMEGYVYNQLTDKYIVPLSTYGGEYVCPGDQHRAMLTAYSNWDGEEQSLQEIGRVYKMRREWLVEYFKVMGWTHSTLPITDEELLQDKTKEAIERVLQTKRTAAQQELQHEDWKSTQRDAENWRMFEAGKLDPFVRALGTFNPKPITKIEYKGAKETNDETLLIGLSDLHFGGKANESELYAGEDFDSKKIQEIMDSYFTQIATEMSNRKKAFKEVAVCSLGDILHGLSGYTVKGTPLDADVLREEQFELALNSLLSFFTRLLTIFKKLSVYAVKGNHAGAGDWILFKTIESYFRTDTRIKFNLYKSRQACFKIGSTAILMDHGASDFAKSIMPTSGAPKEAYVQALFMQYPEILTGAKSRLMISGDRHKFAYEEMRGFEHVLMGSCVVGDRYADNLGLHSRSRQNCLVLSDVGIKEVLSFYFS